MLRKLSESDVLQYTHVCVSDVLQYIHVCVSDVLQYIHVCVSDVLQYIHVCVSDVLQYIHVCVSDVLQYIHVCVSESRKILVYILSNSPMYMNSSGGYPLCTSVGMPLGICTTASFQCHAHYWYSSALAVLIRGATLLFTVVHRVRTVLHCTCVQCL